MADTDVDFDEEGRKILDDLNLTREQQKIVGTIFGKYSGFDPIWRDKKTGGTIFVGNQSAARDKELLLAEKITNIVNCTSNMSNFHEHDRKFTYFRFDVCKGLHSYAVSRNEHRPQVDQVLINYAPAFQFIEGALAKGEHVLVHCLAGAHRAGSTGIACLMYFGGFGAEEATKKAKGARPIISPIGFFSQYLKDLEVALKKERKE